MLIHHQPMSNVTFQGQEIQPRPDLLKQIRQEKNCYSKIYYFIWLKATCLAKAKLRFKKLMVLLLRLAWLDYWAPACCATPRVKDEFIIGLEQHLDLSLFSMSSLQIIRFSCNLEQRPLSAPSSWYSGFHRYYRTR